MSGKPRLFLLDAGPVIALHELDLWREVLARAEIIVPAIVADREAIFWDSGEGIGRPITIRGDENAGLLKTASADATAVADVLARFDPVMRERIDPGEAEALALLYTWDGDPPELCTADGAAVRATCLLDLSWQLVSLEVLLRRVGLPRRHLAPKYTERKFKEWIDAGRQMRIRGEGLV